MKIWFHVQVREWKGHIGTDLGGVKLVSEPLQMNTQHLQQQQQQHTHHFNNQENEYNNLIQTFTFIADTMV